MNGLKVYKKVLSYTQKRRAKLIVLTMNVTLNIQNRTQKARYIQKTLEELEKEFNVKFEKLAPSVYITNKRMLLSKLLRMCAYLVSKLPGVQLYFAKTKFKGRMKFVHEEGKSKSTAKARLMVVLYEAGKNLAENKVKRKQAIERYFKELKERGYEFVDIHQSVKVTKDTHYIRNLVRLAQEIQEKIHGAKCFIVAKVPTTWIALYAKDESVLELLTKVVKRETHVKFTTEEIEIAKKLLEMLQKDKSWRKAIAKRLNGLNISTLEALEKILRKIVE